MADLSRASSFLPTIKCSMCAREIDIAMMGDHVCGVSGEPTPPPDSYGNFDRMPHKQSPSKAPAFLKPARTIPPRVDTFAANRPYFPQDQLTPVSASPSRSMSPRTPSDGQRSPFGTPSRRANSRMQRGPPSPEPLASNWETALPPLPTSKSAAGQRRAPRGGDNGGMGKFADADPAYAPVSPKTATSGGLLKRMNTIAPGPFDINGRRQQADGTAAVKGHRRNPTSGSLKNATMSSGAAAVNGYIRRPSTAGAGASAPMSNSPDGARAGITAPRVPRKNGYGGFGPPPADDDQMQPLRPENRSQTFPRRSGSEELPFRRPSEPTSSSAARNPSNPSTARSQMDSDRSASVSPPRRRKESFSGPDLTRPLPPRGSSVLKPDTDARLGNLPPVPNINLAAEFGIGNPYHTPTESASSNGSLYSEESKASSRSSPASSTGPVRSRRQGSDLSKMDHLLSEMQSSMTDLKPRELPSSISPPRMKGQQARPMLPRTNWDSFLPSPESPMDPAIQGRRFSPIPSRNQTGSPSPLTKQRPIRAPSRSRGNCKGCGDAIRGKSVSSADGRLTGRYHKHCFVCATCSEPFATSTFYVINDAPYCERHYHKLNGSLCTTCDKGIEGQYLESERKQKFHPGCLTCADCNRSLRHDYFEMNGRVYCERDAFRRAQQGRFLGTGGGGSNRMERRTTRLMMM